MNDEQFKKIERTIYRYYETEAEIKVLKREIEEFDKQHKEIDKQLKSNDYISLESNLGSPGFSERVQTSSSGTSSFEQDMFKQCDRLLEEQKSIQKKIFRNEQRIREIERNNIRTRCYIDMLEEDNKKLVELKYRDKVSAERIAEEIMIGRTSFYKQRKQVIQELGKKLNLI